MSNWPPIANLVERIHNGKQNVVDLTKQCLDAIKAAKNYHAILEVNSGAIKRAQQIEADLAAGKKGKLSGIPFIAKDNFLTYNTHTTAASEILEPFQAPYQATAIERLEKEGAIMLAKSNLDAFAHGSSTENSDFGPTKNPFNPAYVPGGSSGGSAAAVKLGLAAFALGTDTGGSIRLPASFCGVVGLKPTYGLVSRYGVIAMASSTDCIGPLTRNVADTAHVLEVIAGKDDFDATTIDRDSMPYTNLKPDLKGRKVGLIKQHFREGIDSKVADKVKQVTKSMAAAGATVTEVNIPVDALALAVYYILVPAEVSSNLARYDGIKYGYASRTKSDLGEFYERTRAEGFGAEAKRRILIGTYVLSSGYYEAYYKRAQTVRTLLIEQYKKAFEQVDILVGPTAPTPPFKLGAKPDPLSMYLTDILTVAADLVGNPGINVPIGQIDGLPVGIQLMADQGKERELLGAAAAVEGLVE